MERIEKTAIVNKIIHFSNVDGPGNRMAIFFQQCNIRCIYCHNPETINSCIHCGDCVPGCPSGALAMNEASGRVEFQQKKCVECDQCIRTCKYSSSPRTKEYTVEELFQEVKEYRHFIRGVTVSGGEPTLQAGFIAELFRRIKSELELSCFVDTNGVFEMGSPEMQELIEAADKFMVDIKTAEPTATLCGVEFTGHLKNLEELLKLGKVHEVRTVLIEGFMDMEKTVRTVKQLLAAYPEVEYRLIRVHPAGLNEERKELIRSHVPQVDQVEGIKVT